MPNRFGFDGQKPSPCSERAIDLAHAVIDVVNTKAALEEAKIKVPGYTAQWSHEDYYAEELEQFYRAAERLESLLDQKPA